VNIEHTIINELVAEYYIFKKSYANFCENYNASGKNE
jgi:hypothetical protein